MTNLLVLSQTIENKSFLDRTKDFQETCFNIHKKQRDINMESGDYSDTTLWKLGNTKIVADGTQTVSNTKEIDINLMVKGIFSGSEDKMEEGTDNENQETIYKDAFQKLNLQKCTDESIKPEDYDICSEESSNNTCEIEHDFNGFIACRNEYFEKLDVSSQSVRLKEDTICKKADENWSYRNKCEIQTTSNKASKSYMRSTVVNKSGNLQKEYQHREDYMNKRKKLQVFHKGDGTYSRNQFYMVLIMILMTTGVNCQRMKNNERRMFSLFANCSASDAKVRLNYYSCNVILSNYDTFWEKLQAVDNEDVLQPEYKLCNGIHYDESTQLCCLHKIQNISHLTFQECCGAEIYHNGTEICIVMMDQGLEIHQIIIKDKFDKIWKDSPKDEEKIMNFCLSLKSLLSKRETIMDMSELKALKASASSGKKASKHKKTRQNHQSHEHSSNIFRVDVLCYLIMAANLVIVEKHTLLLSTSVICTVTVLIWITYSKVKQFKVMEHVIDWRGRITIKKKSNIENGTAHHVTVTERFAVILRNFSYMVVECWDLAKNSRTLRKIHSLNICIFKNLLKMCHALGNLCMACLKSIFSFMTYLGRMIFQRMKRIEYRKLYIKVIKMVMMFLKGLTFLCNWLEKICRKIVSETSVNKCDVRENDLLSKQDDSIGLKNEIVGEKPFQKDEFYMKDNINKEKCMNTDCNGMVHKIDVVQFADTKLSITWTAPGTAFDTKFSIHSNVWWYGVMLYRVITFGHVAYPDHESCLDNLGVKGAIKEKHFEDSVMKDLMSDVILCTKPCKIQQESLLEAIHTEEVKDKQEQDENDSKSLDILENTNRNISSSMRYNYEKDELQTENLKENHLYTTRKTVFLSNTVQTEYYGGKKDTYIHEETSVKAVINSSFSEADEMNDHNELMLNSFDLMDMMDDFEGDEAIHVTENGADIKLCTETSGNKPEISLCRMSEEYANDSPGHHQTCHADENSVRDKVWWNPDGHITPVTEIDDVYSCHKYSQCSDSTKSGKSSSLCLGCNTNGSYEQDVEVYRCESGGPALTNSTNLCKNLKSVSVSDEKLLKHENSEEPMYSSQTVIDLQKKLETKAVKSKYSDGEENLKKKSNDNVIANIVMNTLKEIAKKEVAKICKKSKLHEKYLKKHKKRRISRRRLRRIVFSNRSNSPPSCKIQVTPVQNSPHLQAGLSDVSHENQNSNPNGSNLSLQHVHQQNAVQNGLLNNIPSDMRPDAASATVSKSSFATSLPASSSSLSTYFSRLLMGYEFSVEEKMQYEMLRVQTFQDLPATCHASPLRLARTGFFSNGTNDEVVCFSCGVRYRNWQKRDDPMEIHLKISPECRMVNRRETRNIPIIPESNGFVSHNSHQESLPNLSNGFLQSTVLQDGGVSTQTSLSTQNRTLTRETIQNTNDADTTAQFRNQPQQPYAVQEAMRQPVEEQQTIRPPPSVDRAHSVLEGEQNRPAHRDMAEDLGITLERPKYPAYAQLSVRVSTFQGWPGYLDQAPRDMALAGFFYAGYNDYCRCFFCGGGLRNWDAGDDPWVEHARWFSKCPFVRQNRGHRFVEIIVKRQAEMQASGASGSAKNQTAVTTQSEIEARPQETSQETSMTQTSIQSASANSHRDPAIESVRELGYSDEIIQRAVDIVKSHNPGKENIEARDILEVIFTITDDDTTTQTNTAVVSENTQSSAFGSSQASIQPSVRTTTSQAHTATSSVPASTSESSLPSLSVSSLETANAAVSGGKSGQASANKEITENEIRSLQEENTQLKEQVMCKICMDKNVSIAFLPCGHLACCIDCAPAMRKCPMCRVYIKGTVKTYLA